MCINSMPANTLGHSYKHQHPVDTLHRKGYIPPIRLANEVA